MSDSVFDEAYDAMENAAQKLREPLPGKRDSIKYDVACTLRERIGHLLKAIGDFAVDGIADEYRAEDPAWQELQCEAIALREMMDYV